ncbi:MAG TPA: ADP-ribosylglycohydrolase family protein, partial [Gaiellales bacterium]|nr:ADP-ribosylglycohydrolase family protein [Gaiellales bacterium]
YGGALRDLVASPTWELGEWTDDTAMMLLLADSLADREGYDESDLLARYVIWARSAPKDLPVAVGRALLRARTPAEARLAARVYLDEGAGNEPLARTVPIAIRYRRHEGEIRWISRAESSLTHADPLVGDVCAFFNLTAAALIRGKRPPKPRSELEHELAAAAAVSPAELTELVQRQIGHVLTAARVAFACGLGAQSFEEAVVSAANLGGDADTNAAATGALAGARFGLGAVPQRWLEYLHDRDAITVLASRLVRA